MIYASRYPQGSRIRIRKGVFPIDSSLIGRFGLVVGLNPDDPKKYGVILDGDSDIREFAEDELGLASGASSQTV